MCETTVKLTAHFFPSYLKKCKKSNKACAQHLFGLL